MRTQARKWRGGHFGEGVEENDVEAVKWCELAS